MKPSPPDLEPLIRYFRANPKYYSLALPGFGFQVSPHYAAKEGLKTLLRRNTPAPPERGQPASADIWIDGTHGDRHRAIWQPLISELQATGRSVCLVRPADIGRHSHGGPVRLPGFSWLKGLPDEIGWLPRLSLLGLARGLERDAAAFGRLPSFASVKGYVTTDPFSRLSNLIAIAGAGRVRRVYVQQGIPGGGAWRLPFADSAVVWSDIGRRMLQLDGWSGGEIRTARHPGLPTPATRIELRRNRRAELNLSSEDRLVLFLGQVALEREILPVPGYFEACEICNSALLAARRRNPSVRLLVRPHPLDRDGETAARFADASPLRGSGSAELWSDLVAADVVLGMTSTALEEAVLLGVACAQVVPPDIDNTVDFSSIGVPLARTDSEVLSLLERERLGPVSMPMDLGLATVVNELVDA